MKTATSPLHLAALPNAARVLLKKLRLLAPQGILGGGTAIALQLGHRRSYDLDVFIVQPVPRGLLARAKKVFGVAIPTVDSPEELSCIVKKTKISVITYPFKPLHRFLPSPFIPLFNLRDLASSKAYAIGRRGVWRDYVDLFVILKSGLKLTRVIKEAERRFGDSFNAKLFLEQLSYFDDIQDFSVEWLKKKYTNKEVEQYLQEQVRNYLKNL